MLIEWVLDMVAATEGGGGHALMCTILGRKSSVADNHRINEEQANGSNGYCFKCKHANAPEMHSCRGDLSKALCMYACSLSIPACWYD